MVGASNQVENGPHASTSSPWPPKPLAGIHKSWTELSTNVGPLLQRILALRSVALVSVSGHVCSLSDSVHYRRVLSAGPSEPIDTFTGKLDAGIAVLLGDESSHLIEFPSLLLPPGCQPGSIVSISCTRDTSAEKQRSDDFWSLQDDIMQEFGHRLPVAPSLRQRNVTQTSVALEWDRLETATSKLLGLTIWRNGQRVASIPNPANNTSTKLSGLELDTEYTFHLVLKTTAGTFPSNQLKLRTHKMTNTSGISCVRSFLSASVVAHAKAQRLFRRGFSAASARRRQASTRSHGREMERQDSDRYDSLYLHLARHWSSRDPVSTSSTAVHPDRLAELDSGVPTG